MHWKLYKEWSPWVRIQNRTLHFLMQILGHITSPRWLQTVENMIQWLSQWSKKIKIKRKKQEGLLTKEGLLEKSLDSLEAGNCSWIISLWSREIPDNLSISFSATNHLLNNWILSKPLQETDNSSKLLTVTLKLCMLRAPWNIADVVS